MKKLAVVFFDESLKAQAEGLANCLGLPLVASNMCCADWKLFSKQKFFEYFDGLLLLDFDGLSLFSFEHAFKPLLVDFHAPAIARRLQQAGLKNELVARAVGLKKGIQLRVLDANAGLGQDSMVLAWLGAKMLSFERSAIVYSMLEQGLVTGAQKGANSRLLAAIQNIDLRHIDSREYFSEGLLKGVDVIYLDPMFPEKTKNAKVKKEMQLFQSLLGADEDADELCELALGQLSREEGLGVKRVVVKRPKLAGAVLGRKPSVEFKGKSSRFDVYYPK